MFGRVSKKLKRVIYLELNAYYNKQIDESDVEAHFQQLVTGENLYHLFATIDRLDGLTLAEPWIYRHSDNFAAAWLAWPNVEVEK